MSFEYLFGIPILILIVTLIYMIFDGIKYRKQYPIQEKKKVDDNKYKSIVEYAVYRMSGQEFEEFMVNIFKWNGFKATKTPATRDFGKDIILRTCEGLCYVECKRYSKGSNISSEQINKLLGACLSSGVKQALFITTSNYTKDALKVLQRANERDIDISHWYMEDILRMCLSINKEKVLDYLGYEI